MSIQYPELSQKRILVTGACGVTSRTVVRALRRSSHFSRASLIGIDICDNTFAIYEGLYERIYRVPTLRHVEHYMEQLSLICKREVIDAAVVIPEPEVLFWAENKMPVPALLPPVRFSRAAISKASLYKHLSNTGLVPKFELLERHQIRRGDYGSLDSLPLWLRDFSVGSTSGRGAFCVKTQDEATAWVMLNPGIERFMASEYLPGRNIACLLLYHRGELVKVGCYERLEYFMAKTVMSGVSGNISKGRLVNDSDAVETSRRAIEILCHDTCEVMNGLVTVDLKADHKGIPMITEINLRPVAAASAFAEVVGANLSEAQLFLTLGYTDALGPREVVFSPNNRLFRDIDGLPVFVPDYHPLAVGEYLGSKPLSGRNL